MLNAARLGSFIVLAAEAIADDGTQWIEVMPTVEQDRNGPWFFTITRDDLETWAGDIRSRAGQIPVDYDHAETGVGTKAAGWFTGEAEVREAADGDGHRLWAQVKWTSTAAEAIRDGEWKRISPEMTFAQKDPKTGLLTKAKALVAATLTNRPHFAQLSPVTAATVWESGIGLQDLLGRVFDALNPGGYDHAAFWVMDVTSEKALIGEYDGPRHWVVPFTVSESGEVEPAPRSDWEPAEQEWVSAAMAALETPRAKRPSTEGGVMNDALKAIASELGLADDATDEQVFDAVKTAKASATARGTEKIPTQAFDLLGIPSHSGDATVLAAIKAKDDQITALEEKMTGLETRAAQAVTLANRVAALEKEQSTERIKMILTEEVRAFRVLPSEVDQLAVQFAANPDGLRTLVDARPPNLFAHLSREKGSGRIQEDAAVRAVSDQFGSNEIPVDEDSARLHIGAMEILRAAGKEHEYNEAEYAQALSAAAKQSVAA